MSLRELLALTSMRVADSVDALAFRYRRYQLLNRLSTLHRDRQHFDLNVRDGLEAMRLIDLEIAKTESAFRRLK